MLHSKIRTPPCKLVSTSSLGCSDYEIYIHTTFRCGRWVPGSPRDSRLILVCLPNETQKKLVTHVSVHICSSSSVSGAARSSDVPTEAMQGSPQSTHCDDSNQRPSLCGRRLTCKPGDTALPSVPWSALGISLPTGLSAKVFSRTHRVSDNFRSLSGAATFLPTSATGTWHLHHVSSQME